MTPRRFMPALLLLFVGSGCAALIYEIVWFQLLQLVIGSSAVSLACLARHVHGRHVPRQPPAAALHLGARASAARLCVSGTRHRGVRALHSVRRCRCWRASTRRGAAPAPVGLVFARRRREHLPAAADDADGRDAAGDVALGRDDARTAWRGSASSTAATPAARSSAACSPASTCCACTTWRSPPMSPSR